MIEAKLVLGCLETVLDRPAVALHFDQRFDRRILRTPCGEEGEIAISDAPADQQAARPYAGGGVVMVTTIEVSQFETGPVMEPFAFGPLTRRQALPAVFRQTFGNLLCGPGNGLWFTRLKRKEWVALTPST